MHRRETPPSPLLTHRTMTKSFINNPSKEHASQELNLEQLQAINGAGWVKDALEFIGDHTERTVAFYAGWAGAVAGGSGVAKGAYDAGVNAGIIKEEK